jgi:shikimate dehydrogenase
MLENFSGRTRVYFEIGDPIEQVKAPNLMTRHFHEHGHDVIVVPIRVLSPNVGSFLKAAADCPNVDGIVVTVPHKMESSKHCGTLTPSAALLGSVCVMRKSKIGGWHGEMFDGVGHVDGMVRRGAKLPGARSLLVGAGGAGSAIALALLDAGVSELAIHDQDPQRVKTLIERLSGKYAGKTRVGSPDPTGFDTVTNATPAGMSGDPVIPVDATKLKKNMFVSDVVSMPAQTPLLKAAAEIGCSFSPGIDMFNEELAMITKFFFEEPR